MSGYLNDAAAWIELDKLKEHPDSPSRMAAAPFRKLREHIRRTGLYEPVTVRFMESGYQILNGHQRVRALRELGHERVYCTVWRVDDAEAEVLLATLNRLCGRDQLHRRRELLRRLAKRYAPARLAKMLPGGNRQIAALAGAAPLRDARSEKRFLNAVTFFLTDQQRQSLDTALERAATAGVAGTGAQIRAAAITSIASCYAGEERANGCQ